MSHLIRQFVSFTLKTGWIYFVSNRDILALITTVIKKMYSGERINGKQVSVLCGILKCTCGFFFFCSTKEIRRAAKCNRKGRATSFGSNRRTATTGGCSGSEKSTQKSYYVDSRGKCLKQCSLFYGAIVYKYNEDSNN